MPVVTQGRCRHAHDKLSGLRLRTYVPKSASFIVPMLLLKTDSTDASMFAARAGQASEIQPDGFSC